MKVLLILIYKSHAFPANSFILLSLLLSRVMDIPGLSDSINLKFYKQQVALYRKDEQIIQIHFQSRFFFFLDLKNKKKYLS